jgi:hypothetical protein
LEKVKKSNGYDPAMTVSAVRAERNEENDKKGKADQ